MANSTDLMPKMKDIIKEICEILNVEFSTALRLLGRYEWNKEILIETYTANAEVHKKSRLRVWRHYPFGRQQILEGSNCSLHQSDVENGCLMNDFIKSNFSWRCCPGRDCNRVAVLAQNIQFSDIGGNEFSSSVSCDNCKSSFCIKCGEEPHAPVTCHYLSKWKGRCKEIKSTEGPYGIWIFNEIRPCPICREWIERKQGHSRITCHKCKYEMCWLCMNHWHGYVKEKRNKCRFSFTTIFPISSSAGMSDQDF